MKKLVVVVDCVRLIGVGETLKEALEDAARRTGRKVNTVRARIRNSVDAGAYRLPKFIVEEALVNDGWMPHRWWSYIEGVER